MAWGDWFRKFGASALVAGNMAATLPAAPVAPSFTNTVNTIHTVPTVQLREYEASKAFDAFLSHGVTHFRFAGNSENFDVMKIAGLPEDFQLSQGMQANFAPAIIQTVGSTRGTFAPSTKTPS